MQLQLILLERQTLRVSQPHKFCPPPPHLCYYANIYLKKSSWEHVFFLIEFLFLFIYLF